MRSNEGRTQGRGDVREQRTFLAVLLVGLCGVVLLLWLDPGDAANAALLAFRKQQAESGQSASAVPVRASAPLASGPVADDGDAATDAFALDERIERSEVPIPSLTDPRIAGWVEDLRDDGVPGNALHAMRGLTRLPIGAIPELQLALRASDPQLRHFAAGVLRRRCGEQNDRVTAHLLQVSVEALRSDLGPVSREAFSTPIGPLLQGTVQFLSEHSAPAHDLLVSQLTSSDKQQRFLSAYLLAQSKLRRRSRWQADRIAYELVEHLSDNDVRGDAMMATHGLYRLGEAALPVLLDSRRYLDEQGRKLVDLIRLDLDQPPRTKRDFYRRGTMVNISCIYHDPAVEYDLTRSRVPGFKNR